MVSTNPRFLRIRITFPQTFHAPARVGVGPMRMPNAAVGESPVALRFAEMDASWQVAANSLRDRSQIAVRRRRPHAHTMVAKQASAQRNPPGYG